ncbi:hypothetical protein [Lacticaseibacillus sp. 866-1]|uniref:hypothetical protein n=1 Tax=Lacticaseibacillus sp. 866-1 TaxID=2799576 RepID=UPI0019435B7D|nr:hypothetical protein [Lacticaseibacillus sp. 866-1]
MTTSTKKSFIAAGIAAATLFSVSALGGNTVKAASTDTPNFSGSSSSEVEHNL